ncbi:unnamed protein product [Polarella glacialis]|uniref:Uncharacterized protein n=1 Tax=Polarella glacialis TaxID=89957 RepID=A0A813EYL4_POLGL|nr:unnamed protein product [Polarella glacialis]
MQSIIEKQMLQCSAILAEVFAPLPPPISDAGSRPSMSMTSSSPVIIIKSDDIIKSDGFGLDSVDLGTMRQQLRRLGKDWLNITSWSQILGMSLGFLSFIICLSVELDVAYPKANNMLAITMLVACFWVFEVLPLPVTSLLPLVLMPFFGIMSSSAASTSYWGWVQMLFFGAFVVDIAIEHVNLHRRIALKILLLVGVKRPWLVVLCFLLISFFLAMWCSNTASAVMMVPFATGLLDSALQDSQKTDAAQFRGLSVAVLLAVCYGCSSGGIATLIGTPPNGVLAALPMVAEAVTASNWSAFAMPISILVVTCVFVTLYLLFLRGVKVELDGESVKTSYAALGPVNRDELFVALIQLLQFGGFLIRSDVINNVGLTGNKDLKGVNDATIACAAALLCFVVPSVKRPGEALLTWDHAQQHVPWGVLILMGGGGALAKGFETSLLTKYIGQKLAAATSMGRLNLTFFLTTLVCLVTEVTSNTATANVMLPILAAVSLEVLMHPLALLLPATVACSFAFMLPVATPPNLIVFGTGRLNMKDFLKAGIILNIVASVLGSFAMYFMAGAVYGVDDAFPKWACQDKTCRWVAYPGSINGVQVASQACALVKAKGSCRLVDGSILNYTSLSLK